jgi:hypothetical protein
MFKVLSLSILVAMAASLPVRAGETGCAAGPGCAAAPGCGCNDGEMCCPRCGCHEGLVPVCHPYCDVRVVTKYKYCCVCEDTCIPGKDFCGLGLHCGCDCNKGGCKDCGCESGGCEHCRVRQVHKLVKIPYTVEEPVKKCWVEWVCPRCNCGCNGDAPTGCSEGNAAPTPPSPRIGE